MDKRTELDYFQQLCSLMPQGLAWNFNKGGALSDLLENLAKELSRVDNNGTDLAFNEFYPQSTLDLLVDFEKEYGLPDDCQQLGETIEQRRKNLLFKVNALGGQSKEYFISLAEILGFTITITEFRPFRIGVNSVGNALQSEEWQFVWRVNTNKTSIFEFTLEHDTAGTALKYWTGIELLECILNKYKPAHTLILFNYSGDN